MALPLRPADPRELHLRGMVARDGYERWLAREVEAVLRAAFEEIAQRILVDGGSLQLRDRLRLQAFFDQITQRLSAAYGDVSRLTTSAMADYWSTELEAAGVELDKLLGGAITQSGVRTSTSLALLTHQFVQSVATLPIQGLRLGEWWESQAASMSIATRRTIQQGLAVGEDTRQIARRIIPARGSVTPAAWRRARSEALAIVRTTTTAVHADAALTAYQGMDDDVTDSYSLLAVRDGRTSTICISLDGRVFRYDDPKRLVPPFHIHCRTTCQPIVEYEKQGLEPPPVARAKGITFQSMDAWLRSQPKSAQAEILGRSRADLYQAKKMTLRDLVDSDARVVPLPELRKKLGLGPRLH